MSISITTEIVLSFIMGFSVALNVIIGILAMNGFFKIPK
jgi:hypothetical protein